MLLPSANVRISVMLLLCCCGAMACRAGEAGEKPITASEARKKVGQRVWVELTIQVAKDRLEKRGEIYLDSELDFRDERNLAIVITKEGASSLKESGVANPAEHFMGQTIRVRGEVSVQQDVPRIEVNDAKQIFIPEPAK